jgi:hypothetical protein
MILLAVIIPFVSVLFVGYLVYSAPEVAND